MVAIGGGLGFDGFPLGLGTEEVDSGGDVTLSAAKGSFALTGGAAHERIIESAGEGAFALTGSAATLSFGEQPGHFLLTEGAASAEIVQHEGRGAFAVAGGDATFDIFPGILAEKGSFSETEGAASVTIRMSAGTGSFALTGQDATGRPATRLDAAAGHILLTGHDVTFPTSVTLNAAKGHFALAEEAATGKVKINAPKTAFSLAGLPAHLVLATEKATWDGLLGALLEDMDAAQTTMTTRFNRGGWLFKPVPFDIGFGGERIKVTDMGLDYKHWTIERGVNGTPNTPHYAGGVFQELRHEILVTKGGNTWDYSIIVGKGFDHGSAIPTGETECRIQFETTEDGWIPDPDSRLVLSSNETGEWVPYYSGLVQRPSYIERDDGSLSITLIARGYGHSATFDEWVRTIQPGPDPDTLDDGVGWWRAYTPGHIIVEDTLAALCPLISSSKDWIRNGGQDFLKEYNAKGQKPSGVFDTVCAQGDAGDVLDWAVYTDVDGSAKMWLLRRPSWPLIDIEWSAVAKGPNEIPLAWDTDEVCTRVVVYFAGGVAEASAGTGIVRTQSFHCENTIDDLGTAQSIANTMAQESAILQMLTENPIVLTYKADDPANHYATWRRGPYAGFPVQLWRFFAGPLVQFPGLTARNGNLPITPIQIKSCAINHMNRTVTLQLGVFWDFAKLANLYGHAQALAPNSDTHLPGASAAITFTQPELGLPGSLTPSLTGLGSGGRIGHDQVAKDADINAGGMGGWTDFAAPDGDPIALGRKPDWPIGANGELLGMVMTARDNTDPSGTVNVTVELALLPQAGGFGAAGTTFMFLPYSGAGDELRIDLDPDQAALLNKSQYVNAGDHLSVVVSLNDSCYTIELRPIFRRTEGSDRATTTAPAIVSGVTATRDASNTTRFTITSDRSVYAQIEYGLTTTYGARSQKTEVSALNPVVNVRGLPQETVHYRVHLWSVDNVETISGDHTV